VSRERQPDAADGWFARHLRARAAVLTALQTLRDAHAAHDPAPLSISELSGAVRRWIDGQTFAPRLGATGVMLLDASAAPYADVDEIRIVGLSEADWPERSTRSIFYPSRCSASSDGRGAGLASRPLARFHDLPVSRAGASRSLPSRSRTMPLCPPRRCSKTWTAPGCRSSGW
jgi:hypothetical protein